MQHLTTMEAAALLYVVDEALRSPSLVALQTWGVQRGLACTGSVHHAHAGTIRGRIGEGYIELLWEKQTHPSRCACVAISCALWASNQVLVLEKGRIATSNCTEVACTRR